MPRELKPGVIKEVFIRELSESGEIQAYFKAALEWIEVQLIALGESDRVMTWPAAPDTLKLTVKARLGFRLDEGGNTPFTLRNRENFLIGTANDLVINTFHEGVTRLNTSPAEQVMLNAFLGAAWVGKELLGDQTPWGHADSVAAFQTALWGRLTQRTDESKTFYQQFAVKLLKDHLENPAYNKAVNDAENKINALASKKAISDIKVYDIKENFLRLPVFLVETLSLYCGIQETQTEQRINALVVGQYISQTMGDALGILIRFGLDLRTRVHLHYRMEEDTVYLDVTAAQDKTNPYLLSAAEKTVLLLLTKVMLKPTQQILSAVFSSDSAYPYLNQWSKTHDLTPYKTALKVSADTIKWLRETALDLRSWGDWQHAMRYSRFSLTVADEDIDALDPQHDVYDAYLAELAKPEYSVTQRLNLPQPNGMRPLMLRKKRQWQTDLMRITVTLKDPTATTPPTGRLLLEIPDVSKRLLRSKTAMHILQQLIEPETLHGNRPVIMTEYFCFKLFPEYLGTEIAASDLIERLIGGYVQEVALGRLTDSKGTEWPVLIMRRIPGKNLKESCCITVEKEGKRVLVPDKTAANDTLEALSKIDPEQFSRLFIAALLTTNEDGKDDNIMLTLPEKTNGVSMPMLTFIDNDRCFLPPITKDIDVVKKARQLNLQMKQFIFCMDQMKTQSLHDTVKREILSLDFHELLKGWLAGLAKHNEDCFKLFGESKILDYYDPAKDTKRPSSVLPAVLIQNTETRLFSKLRHLRTIIERNPTSTLLNILCDLEPDAGAIYHKAFQAHKKSRNLHAIDRWCEVSGNYYRLGSNQESVSIRNYEMISKSLHLNSKVNLRELLQYQASACCLPSQAQERLFKEHHSKSIREELYQGNVIRFQRLTNAMKKVVLASIPFEKLNDPENISKQQQIFKALQTVTVNELSFRHAYV